MKLTRLPKEPTTTSLVVEALTRRDDFMTGAQLTAATGRGSNQVWAALSHLRNRHVVDSVESAGRLWWFLTAADDDRQRVVEERRPEDKPRRGRRASDVK